MTDLITRSPMSAIERRFADMEQMLDRLGARSFWRTPDPFADSEMLALDVREEDGAFVVETSLPGYKKDEIEVELWAAPNGSYSLSARLVKPESPPF